MAYLYDFWTVVRFVIRPLTDNFQFHIRPDNFTQVGTNNLITSAYGFNRALLMQSKTETSGYAMVVHGRPQTPKMQVFWGVTQPPGVAQPLYSRAHN